MSLIESSVHHHIHELRLQRAPVNALNPELCNALTHALHMAVAQGAHGIVPVSYTHLDVYKRQVLLTAGDYNCVHGRSLDSVVFLEWCLDGVAISAAQWADRSGIVRDSWAYGQPST